MASAPETSELDVLKARVAALTAELAERAAEHRMYRSVLDTVPAVVMRVSLDGRIEFINRVLPEYAGVPLVGQPIYTFAPPDQHEVMRTALERAIATRQVTTFESVAVAPDGTRDWYASTLGPVLDGEKLVALTIVSTNTTHLKRIEQELRESRAKLTLALDAGNVGVWRWDQQRDVVEWDDKMCALFGVTREQAPTTYAAFLALASDDQRAALRTHIETALATGNYPDFELRADLPGGTRWFIIKGGTLRDADGTVTGLLGGVVDDTQRRQVELHLRHTQKLEAVGQLSAGVAHNFNNMLAVIVPVLELVQRRVSGVDADFLGDGLTSALNAAQLVKQLMVFSHSQPVVALRPEPLAEAVERAVELGRRTFDRRITLEVEGLESARDVGVDGGQMEQAVLNLLLNARDALEGVEGERARIELRLRRVPEAEAQRRHDACRGEHVELRVRDFGAGMPAATRQRIFEPFFTTKEVGKGTGLGLSTTWATVQQHRGFLDCESVVNRGTTFTFLLPVEGAGVASSWVSPPPMQAADQGEHVLLIDDEPAVCRANAAVLSAQGYVVFTAASGEEGVRLAAQERVDVVLLDYSMPGLSARATLERLRAQRPALPVVCFSGLGVTLEGATVHLAKPVTAAELVDAVARALARAAPTRV